MGHSLAFLDAEWLAREILGWLIEEQALPEGYLSLPNTQRQLEVTVYPLNWGLTEPSQRRCAAQGGRTVTIRMIPNDETRGTAAKYSSSLSPGARAARAFLNEYSITVHDWVSERIPKPKTYRIAIRKSLGRGKERSNDNDGREPFFYRRWDLYVSAKTPFRLLSLQLAVVFTHWKILDITAEDLDEFRHFCISLFRKPEKFEQAAEEALSYIFSNWVMPQDPEDFTRYVKQAVWALYNKGAGSIGSPTGGSREGSWGRSNGNRKGEDRRSYAPKRRTRKHPGFVSISELQAWSQTREQRIHEAINAGTLKAQKFGKSRFVTIESATAYVLRAQIKRKIREKRAELEDLGMSKDAVGKSIQRHCKDRTDFDAVLQHLQDLDKRISRKQRTSQRLRCNDKFSD
ncbi:MAG TPA: hypothetical protein VJQ82_11605 [Terriglobales bacterium]|nr:hypothetical protein [Terriglobales bacterium]